MKFKFVLAISAFIISAYKIPFAADSIQNDKDITILETSVESSLVEEVSAQPLQNFISDAYDSRKFIEGITKENVIDKVATDYNGENEYLGGVVCDIDTNAVFYEIDWKQALELVKNRYNCIILFSAPWCPYCKAEIMPFTKAASFTNTPIFYVNVEKYPRPTYELEKSRDGGLSYYYR